MVSKVRVVWKLAEPCQHGGTCIGPNKCGPCDEGWLGAYCQLASCHASLVRALPDGQTQDLGCYHGGQCMGQDACAGCLGGWEGFGCETVPLGFLPLLVGACM